MSMSEGLWDRLNTLTEASCESPGPWPTENALRLAGMNEADAAPSTPTGDGPQ